MQAPTHRAAPPKRRHFTASITRLARRGMAPAWRGAVYALIACVFAYPDRAPAQALWRGLDVGASLKSVRQVFPEARQPLAVTTLADGETDDLTTHGLFLGDRLMEVRFFFRDDGLTSVQLSPVATPAQRQPENLKLAKDLADRLSARYGNPFDCGDKTFAGMGQYSCKWLQGPIIIRLWYIDAVGEAPSLRIAFRRADDAAYDF